MTGEAADGVLNGYTLFAKEFVERASRGFDTATELKPLPVNIEIVGCYDEVVENARFTMLFDDFPNFFFRMYSDSAGMIRYCVIPIYQTYSLRVSHPDYPTRYFNYLYAEQVANIKKIKLCVEITANLNPARVERSENMIAKVLINQDRVQKEESMDIDVTLEVT